MLSLNGLEEQEVVKTKKIFKKIFKRGLFYIQQGYSIASLPFAFLGYASSIYYLAIQNIPFLEGIFPGFADFLVTAGIGLPILCGLVGYCYIKRSWLFKTAMIVQTEANPFTTKITTPVNIPAWQFQALLARKYGWNDVADALELVINNTKKQFEIP